MMKKSLLVLCGWLWCVGAAAQTYPSKPIRMVLGFAPGGASDVLTRVISAGLAKELGGQVVVENKPGAEGIIAATEVMRAAPDGHTLLMGTNTAMVAVPSLKNPPPYDAFKAFTPISSAGQFSMFLVVSTALPVKTVAEFLDHVAANPNKYNSASSNSASELAMLQLLAGRKVVNARYKGDVQALADLVGGNIHMIFSTGTLAPGMVKEGKARALLALQPQRSPLMPDVPTATEAGIGSLTIKPWSGFFGPAGMAPELTNRISAALVKAIASPEVRDQLTKQGIDGYGMSPAQFAAFFRQQHDSFNQIVRENNIKFE